MPAGKLEFDWFADGLRVSDLSYHPREPFATAKIDNGEQHWPDLMRRKFRTHPPQLRVTSLEKTSLTRADLELSYSRLMISGELER